MLTEGQGRQMKEGPTERSRDEGRWAGNRGQDDRRLECPIPQKGWSCAWLPGAGTLGCSIQPRQLPQLGAPGDQHWVRMGGKKSNR